MKAARAQSLILAGCVTVALAVAPCAAAGADEADDLAAQIRILTKSMRQALERHRPDWTDEQRDAYVDACREALNEYLTEPLSPDDLRALRRGERDWARDCLPPTVTDEHMQWHVDGLRCAVSEMVGRPRLLAAEREQSRIDQQIDFFCDRLRAALPLYFSKDTSEAAMTEVAHEIHRCLKANSRNPWFPALKQPLDRHEIGDLRKSIHHTLATQLRDFRQREAEHGRLAFDLGVTSAWSMTTKLVSKTIDPPADQMLMFTHSPIGAALGFQVRPPMVLRPEPSLDDQVGSLVEGMRQALDWERPEWSDDQREAYSAACRDALERHLTEPMEPADLDIIRSGERDWVHYCLPAEVTDDALEVHRGTLDHLVGGMLAREHIFPPPPEQQTIDRQADLFCDLLTPGLPRIYQDYSSREALVRAAEEIRFFLKIGSRNPWFPALKRPLLEEEERQLTGKLVNNTLSKQLRKFKRAAAGGLITLGFDWGVAGAWTAASEFVSRTAERPTDGEWLFAHSPGMTGLAVEVRQDPSGARLDAGEVVLGPAPGLGG